MASGPHKLNSAVAGALAAGGDPATSPLYVFGPFLTLIIAAGVAPITFGASVWLAVITVVTVSALYRLVMSWVSDGSGGTGLSEEEFGAWAGKVNASITFVEYTLTFLVSMSALVTFLSDRFSILNASFGGLQARFLVATGLTVVTVLLVNQGPRVAALVFGPATAGVLILLWIMMVASVLKLGFQLPAIHFEAFTPRYLGFTLGGYARILALMTGIEVFANLVAAYEGRAEQRARKAFGSLVLIMGSTSLSMVILGPAILQLADPARKDVSVFTQTMDALLPAPLAYLGTLVGVAVLLSACATSAEGLQNLGLGLSLRRFIPAWMGRTNRFGVAPWPAWLQGGLVIASFFLFGTREETYLALYAAGVFILLSMTAWAATKRLWIGVWKRHQTEQLVLLAATTTAALLTTTAAALIFWERFFEGAWTYLVMIPVLFAGMTLARKQRGLPTAEEDRIGKRISCACCGLGPERKNALYCGDLDNLPKVEGPTS